MCFFFFFCSWRGELLNKWRTIKYRHPLNRSRIRFRKSHEFLDSVRAARNVSVCIILRLLLKRVCNKRRALRLLMSGPFPEYIFYRTSVCVAVKCVFRSPWYFFFISILHMCSWFPATMVKLCKFVSSEWQDLSNETKLKGGLKEKNIATGSCFFQEKKRGESGTNDKTITYRTN